MSTKSLDNKTIIILLLTAFLGGMAAYIVSVVRNAEPAPQPHHAVSIYEGVPLDAKLIELDKRALDEAYHAQILKLWGVWLTDGGKDPTYFKNGLNNARRAYNQAHQQIEKREQELPK